MEQIKLDQEQLNRHLSKNLNSRKRSIMISEKGDQQLEALYYECRKKNNAKSYGQIVNEALDLYYHQTMGK